MVLTKRRELCELEPQSIYFYNTLFASIDPISNHNKKI